MKGGSAVPPAQCETPPPGERQPGIRDGQVWAQRGLHVSSVTEPAGCSREAGASEPERRETEAQVLGSRLPYLQAGPDGWALTVALGAFWGQEALPSRRDPREWLQGL